MPSAELTVNLHAKRGRTFQETSQSVSRISRCNTKTKGLSAGNRVDDVLGSVGFISHLSEKEAQRTPCEWAARLNECGADPDPLRYG